MIRKLLEILILKVRNCISKENSNLPAREFLKSKMMKMGATTKNCMSFARYQDCPMHTSPAILGTKLLT